MVEEIINFHSSQGLKFLHISVEISATWLICSVFLCSQPPECSSVLLCRNWCRFSVCVHTLHWDLCFVLHWFRDGVALVERDVIGFHKNEVHPSSQWIMSLPGIRRQLIPSLTRSLAAYSHSSLASDFSICAWHCPSFLPCHARRILGSWLSLWQVHENLYARKSSNFIVWKKKLYKKVV